jgi:hypothetical protein
MVKEIRNGNEQKTDGKRGMSSGGFPTGLQACCYYPGDVNGLLYLYRARAVLNRCTLTPCNAILFTVENCLLSIIARV